MQVDDDRLPPSPIISRMSMSDVVPAAAEATSAKLLPQEAVVRGVWFWLRPGVPGTLTDGEKLVNTIVSNDDTCLIFSNSCTTLHHH